MPVTIVGTVKEEGVLAPGLVEAHSDPLYINVRGCRWEMDGMKGSYAGATAQSVTDDQTNYVYIDSSGSLQINTTGFPAASVTHIRLARVVTANGEIVAIYEERAMFSSGTGGGGVSDHGALTGLEDDDHSQYHNDARGDSRYSQLGHTHTESDITDLDHTDDAAIHDNVAGEIAAVTEKASPVSADLLLIEDSADGNNKKRVQVGNLPGGGGGGDWAIRCPCGGDDTGSVYINDTDWEVLRSFRFPGTGVVTPSVFRAVLSRAGTTQQNDIRLYDFTNAQVIAEITLTSDGKAVYSDTSLQNLPASQAIWEVQGKKSAVQASLGYLHEFEVE